MYQLLLDLIPTHLLLFEKRLCMGEGICEIIKIYPNLFIPKSSLIRLAWITFNQWFIARQYLEDLKIWQKIGNMINASGEFSLDTMFVYTDEATRRDSICKSKNKTFR